jgi:signal transduction histidine kinase
MKQHYPGWRSNLSIFIIIILFVGGYFYRQTRQASREIQKHAQEHAEMLAAVVELNIKNTLLSQNSLEEILGDSLKKSARFISYLNSIEAFSGVELSAYASESGLAGVMILQKGKENAVSGPPQWLADASCGDSPGLLHLEQEKFYVYSYSEPAASGSSRSQDCVLVGLSDTKINETLEKISVSRLLLLFGGKYNIAYIRFGAVGQEEGRQGVLETRIDIGGKELLVGLKRDRFEKRQRQMHQEFMVFLGILVLFGAFSSWWLYRMQRQNLRQTRDFERKMARQHEDAALGRAAATITHELKNPLNAMGMGLQRLQLEAADLDPDHKELLVSMRGAVDRSDTILTRLRQSIHSLEVDAEDVDVITLIQQAVTLYRVQCDKQGIQVTVDCKENILLAGDTVLLGELLENLFKNSVEAQLKGGFIHVRLYADGMEKAVLEIRNAGFLLTEKESQLLFEPYFTSKSQGTGLGLVISEKIVAAHGGVLQWHADFDKDVICFQVVLPLAGSVENPPSSQA